MKGRKCMQEQVMVTIGSEYDYLVQAVLNRIRNELDRLYWNKNQKEMISPFDNSGAPTFSTDVFTVRSYNWDENIEPNFETEKMKIWWYKHSNRGLCVKIPNGAHAEDVIAEALYDSIKSLGRYFKEIV